MGLKQVINNQSVIIDTIVNRLNFMLSMFNIDEISVPPLSMDPYVSEVINGAISSNSMVASAEQSGHAAANNSTKLSYSSVASQKNQTQQPLKQLTQFRQSLVAAVYIDQSVRDSRASSFIISGLPISAEHSDKALVTEISSNEFNIQVDIVNTKRLGKTLSSSSSTVSLPHLVNVKNTEHAKQIISSARQLRQSAVPFVRDNVYIISRVLVKIIK